MQRLHRVDDADVRPLRLERRAYRVELGLREDLDRLGTAQTRGPEQHLSSRLLARHEQRSPPAPRDRAECREQERGLPDPGLTPNEHERGSRPRPPPSTRSSSDTPVGMRAASSMGTAPIAMVFDGDAKALVDAEPWSSSTRLPNAPQPGHFPSQRPDIVPHSAHVN